MRMASSGVCFPSKFCISSIKNKKRRTEVYGELKRKKGKDKLELKKRKLAEEKVAKEMGLQPPVKEVPKTLDSIRVKDDTMVEAEDEEVAADQATDEMGSYSAEPKVLITTSDRPKARTKSFTKELRKVVPNSVLYYRRGLDVKKIICQADCQGFTDVIVVNENMRKPNEFDGLLVIHLPEGPTAHFKLTNMRLTTEIKGADGMTHHRPEVILNNFNTRLGVQVSRLLACLFNTDPNYHGRRVVTFHNQRDFIFFRQHRYQFKDGKKVALKELGPRFTLKLRSLQKGTFDSKYGHYEWLMKRHEMETSRRKFFL